MKKITRVMLLLLACAMLLCACEKNKGPSVDTDQDIPTDTDDGYVSIEEWLPTEKFGSEDGAVEVTLMTLETYNNNYHFISNDELGDELNRVAMERTYYINEMYNVDLVCAEIKDSAYVATLTHSIAGGGGDYDILYPHPNGGMANMIVNNLMTDLNAYDYIHLDQPWWNQTQVQNYSLDGKLYIAASDMSLSGQGFVGMIFNREIYESLDLDEDLYTVVKDKKWTMEKLRTLSMLYGGDNGDDVYDEKDTYGLVYQSQQSASLLYSMGEKILNFNAETEKYEFALDGQRLNGVAKKLKELIWDSENHVYVGPTGIGYKDFPTTDGWQIFKSGQALFMTYDIGALYTHLRDLTFDVGYLPLPLYDETQDDYAVFCGAGFFAIPNKAADPEMSSIILEALTIYSYSEYRPAFFNTILFGRLSHQEADYEMLEFLHEHKLYDIGYTFDTKGSAALILINVVVNKKSTNTASYMQNRANEFQAIVDAVEGLRTKD